MKRLIPCLLLAAVLPLAAQFNLESKDRDGKPILINSDAMSVDIEKGIATFYGNVVVNDPDVIITCKKMVLYQDPKAKKEKKANKQEQKKNSKDPFDKDNTKLERIECIDDVVITRKNTGDKSQWGTSGKAVYYHKEGSITMTIDPVLYQDESKITGTRLTFYRDSKQIEGTDIKISARNLKDEELKDKKAEPGKKTEEKNPDADAVDNFYKQDNAETEAGNTAGKQTRKLSKKETDALLGLDKVPAN